MFSACCCLREPSGSPAREFKDEKLKREEVVASSVPVQIPKSEVEFETNRELVIVLAMCIAAILAVRFLGMASAIGLVFGTIGCRFMLTRHWLSKSLASGSVADTAYRRATDYDSDAWFELRERLLKEVNASGDVAVAEVEAVQCGDSLTNDAQSSRGGFNDMSTPGVCKTFVKVDRSSQTHPKTTMFSDLTMQGIELLKVHNPHAPQIYGAMPVMLECERWPEWVLMCDEVDVLHRWSMGECLVVAYFKLPIINIRIESMLYLRYFDKMDSDGCVGTCIAGGERVKQLATEMGLTAPLSRKSGYVVRGDVDYVHVSIYPSDHNRRMRFMIRVEESCPLDWIVHYIWGTITTKLMGKLAREVESHRANHMDGMSETREEAHVAFYRHMEQRIANSGKVETFPSDVSTSAASRTDP